MHMLQLQENPHTTSNEAASHVAAYSDSLPPRQQPPPTLRSTKAYGLLRAKKGLKEQNIQRGGARPYTPFFVPEDLLQPSQSNAQTQSSLFQLPTELLLLIVERLQIPYFQVVFGLTCKAAASLLCERREVLAPWRGFRDKEGLYRLLVRRPKISEGELARHPHSSHMPQHLRLCRACWRHLPRSEQWWLGRMSRKEFDKPHVNWFDVLNFFAESQRNCGQHKCPECCVRNYTCFMSEREYDRALAEDYRDEKKHHIDLDKEGGRRVCVELPRRLARP